jgi:hypothetical protein
MRYLALLAVLALMSVPAAQAEERPLTGDEIRDMLTDKEIIGTSGSGRETRQSFSRTGRTGYNDGHLSWGYWDVRDDQYCSQWPPQQNWVCYDMAVWQDGDKQWVAWVGESGTRYEGYIKP